MQSVPSVSRRKLGNKETPPHNHYRCHYYPPRSFVNWFDYYLDVNDSNFTCRELDLGFAAMSSGRRDSVPFQLFSFSLCARTLLSKLRATAFGAGIDAVVLFHFPFKF